MAGTPLTPAATWDTPLTVAGTDVLSSANMGTVLQTHANREQYLGETLPPETTVITSSTTWTPDADVVFVRFVVVGPGGDGADGTASVGGGGGGSGEVKERLLSIADLQATDESSAPELTITIGTSSGSTTSVVGEWNSGSGTQYGFKIESQSGNDGSGSTGGASSGEGSAAGGGGGTDGNGSSGGDGRFVPGGKYGSYLSNEGYGGSGGIGYGAGGGGGGGGTTTGTGDGGGGGASGYGGYGQIYASQGKASTNIDPRAGGAGAQGVVMVTVWRNAT